MAKIGDFAVARFDDVEVPCLITGRSTHNPNEQTFVYWRKNRSGKFVLKANSLPKNRLESMGINVDYISNWESNVEGFGKMFESIKHTL